MIDLYFWPTPNGWKIALMLEECGLAYNVVKTDIGRGGQFKPEFIAISRNNKIPAIVDHAGRDGPISVFESGAILLYLAEKTGRFIPRDTHGRYDVSRAQRNTRVRFVPLCPALECACPDPRYGHEAH
ncbi:MAG: hypothetical protein FJ197_06830 [Gammaproteobacteria bacterium]|nr:hypothetical protein [Gammaproteobacteria bacterium]